MASARGLNYDHPSYITPYVFAGSTAVGANGATAKFAAFTAMQIRAVVTGPNVAGTSSSNPLLFTKSGTATATATLTAITSASVTQVQNILTTAVALAQGDQFWVTHGTDATASLSAAIECYATPGANLVQNP